MPVMSQHNQQKVPAAKTRSNRIVWFAVLLGVFVDQIISSIILGIGSQADPNINNGTFYLTAAGLITAGLLAVSTGVGGWSAGRLAKQERVLHGALVGGVGLVLMVLLGLAGERWQIDELLVQFAGTALGALGGWLSRFVPTRQ